MVEFALILPLQLLLILGALQVGLALVTRIQLVHAAQQGAVIGASEPVVSQRCDRAIEAATTVYGSAPDAAECSQPGNVVQLRLTDAATVIGPFGTWNVVSTGRAVTP